MPADRGGLSAESIEGPFLAVARRNSLCDDDAWEAHIHEVLAGLWAHARRGIAFNLMIRTPKPADPHVYTGDPEGWAVWCSQNLPGARVALRMGPPLDDFTVLVRRAPSGE